MQHIQMRLSRGFTKAEEEAIFDSIAAASEPLNGEERAKLSRELRVLTETMASIWESWVVPFRKQAAQLRAAERAARRLENALRALSAQAKSSLVHTIVSGQAARATRSPNEEGNRVLQDLTSQLDEVATAASEAASAKIEFDEKFDVVRGHDRACQFLANRLMDIWTGWTKSPLDLWEDKTTKEYHGKFWAFVRASTAVCREFMGDKATDAALFSRMERLTRGQGSVSKQHGRQLALPLRRRVARRKTAS